MESLHWTTPDDRGVSETIGFVLIFSIVVAGIALVTLYGYPLLLQQQVGADEKIMEKNMIVLQNDIKSLAYKTVPFKETSLKIGGGSLTVYNSSADTSTTFTIQDSDGVTYAALHPGELRYESVSAETDIALQNGAVVMRPRIGEGSTMIAEPRWFIDYDPRTGTRTMVVNLINITSTDQMSKEGIGTVQMTLGETRYIYKSWAPGSKTITVECNFPADNDYSVAWNNYLTNAFSKHGISGAPGPVYTIPAVNTLVIKEYEVQIKSI